MPKSVTVSVVYFSIKYQSNNDRGILASIEEAYDNGLETCKIEEKSFYQSMDAIESAEALLGPKGKSISIVTFRKDMDAGLPNTKKNLDGEKKELAEDFLGHDSFVLIDPERHLIAMTYHSGTLRAASMRKQLQKIREEVGDPPIQLTNLLRPDTLSQLEQIQVPRTLILSAQVLPKEEGAEFEAIAKASISKNEGSVAGMLKGFWQMVGSSGTRSVRIELKSGRSKDNALNFAGQTKEVVQGLSDAFPPSAASVAKIGGVTKSGETVDLVDLLNGVIVERDTMEFSEKHIPAIRLKRHLCDSYMGKRDWLETCVDIDRNQSIGESLT